MTSTDTQAFDITKSRASFPALKHEHQVYFDNAGGTQVLESVSTAIRDYLLETNVQLGASYDVSQQSTDTYNHGLEAAAGFINTLPDNIVLGPSTTQLYANLAQILNLPADAELVLSSLDHEANIASWVRLAGLQNLTVKWWRPTPSAHSSPNTSPLLTPENLRPLLSEKTAFVACTHTSNVLGSIHDVKAIADEVHKIPKAKLCVDGVAYAPHREVDVNALGVDFYAFSWYKVYGPHISLLYASPIAQRSLSSLGHYFHTSASISTRLGLASASYELVAAIPAICTYIGRTPDEKKKTWDAIAKHEEEISEVLLHYLRSRKDITIWGHASVDKEKRVPVISFTVRDRSSKDIVEGIEAKSNFGCRYGAFYSNRLVEEVLGLEPGDGVVRVSLVHYNTKEEVEGFVGMLDGVLEGGR